MLTENDKIQLAQKGINQAEINQQVDFFRNGFPWMNLGKAATPSDGVLQLSKEQIEKYQQIFDQKKSNLSILKMVPASGAATRMFKSLFEHLTEEKENKESKVFFERISEFAFAPELKKLLPEWSTEKEILEQLLLSYGMDYGSLPKGLLAFHYYPEGPRTPLEEHLVEAASYASDGKTARLHFTVSPEHRKRFESLVEKVVPNMEAQFGIKYDITFSEQKPSTDTVAVDLNNELFRDSDGSLLFRPAGHGALLENLNDLQADIIFIKNIDNVVPDKLKEPTIVYKKVLGGLLIEIVDHVKQLYAKLENSPNEQVIQEVTTFASDYLGIQLADNFVGKSLSEKVDFLKSILNRPTRICGVVKNTGEPGGGPFWCKDADGNSTLQLVESA